MQLKTVPEDFIVAEIGEHPVEQEGPYVLLEMTKRNMSTEKALDALKEYLDVPRRFFGYAGAKDARAITRQHITIKVENDAVLERIKKLNRDSIRLRIIGFRKEPLGLGMLEGNRFDIVCRDLAPEEQPHPMGAIPNFFDEQRFSSSNAQIGRHIIKGEYVAAAQIIATTDREAGDRIKEYLEEKPNDAIGALRFIPKNILLMYVHAFQSELYNEVLRTYILSADPDAITIPGPVAVVVPTKPVANAHIPIIGFGSELEEPFLSWYETLLARDDLAQRDFVVRSLPFLSVEGNARDAFFAIGDLEIGPREPDEIHPGKEKQRLSFRLPKAVYATMAIKCLFRTGIVRGS